MTPMSWTPHLCDVWPIDFSLKLESSGGVYALHTPDSSAPSVTPPNKARGGLGRPDRCKTDEVCVKIGEF